MKIGLMIKREEIEIKKKKIKFNKSRIFVKSLILIIYH